MSLAETNRVALYMSKETDWGENPASPAMQEIKFTGESLAYNKESLTSEQIRSDSQREEVALAGFNVEGDINFEFQYGNLDLFWELLMSSSFVTIAVNGVDLEVDAIAKTIERVSGSFVADNVKPGVWIKTSGFTEAGNNGIFKVKEVTALVITLKDDTTGLVDEVSASGREINAKYIKNGINLQSLLVEKRFLDITKYIYYSGLRLNTTTLN
ncbi:hypothetical protein KKC59_04620, partial [bacterium]|nr:hypothetical protein [bacterium]